jgi:hypothetical protein
MPDVQYTDQETFEYLEKVTQKFFPRYKVVPKQSVWIHRAIGWVLKSLHINSNYMDGYFTYFANTNAYPIEGTLGEHYKEWRVHMHEGTHAAQEKRWSLFLWGLAYLLGTPVYAVLGLLISLPLWFVGGFTSLLPWWSGFIPVALGVILSSPIPGGVFRTEWELQGYGASIAVYYWTEGKVPDAYVEKLVDTFAGGNYFYMCVFRKKVRRRLKKARRLVQDRKFIFNWVPRCSSFYSAYYRGLKEQRRTKI